MAKLSKIHGINDKFVVKLKVAGITTIEKLLEEGSSSVGRQSISKKTRINSNIIQKWVNHADFFRIKGIAGLKAELLDATGIKTVKKLATQKPEKLYQHLQDVNDKTQMLERVPGLIQVKRWVSDAKKISKKVK